jgi:hypothetical protein
MDFRQPLEEVEGEFTAALNRGIQDSELDLQLPLALNSKSKPQKSLPPKKSSFMTNKLTQTLPTRKTNPISPAGITTKPSSTILLKTNNKRCPPTNRTRNRRVLQKLKVSL